MTERAESATARAPLALTGAGSVSPYGVGVAALLRGLSAGLSGVRPVTAWDVRGSRATKAAWQPDFTPESFDGSSGFCRLPRGTQLAIIAADEALREAHLDLEHCERGRVGTFLASSRIALEKTEQFYQVLLAKGARLANPLAFQETVNNAPVAHICLRYRLTGPSVALTCGGVAALQALGLALDWLRAGRLDWALVVAADSISPVCQLSHGRAGGHAPIDPHGVNDSCPFDRRRNGYVLGEGAVGLVLETGAHAQARGVAPLAWVYDVGLGHDPAGAGRFDASGQGLEAAMRTALAGAGLEPGAIGWVLASAHASRSGDAAEARAITRVFGPPATAPPVSALKSMLGETEGAGPGFGLLAAAAGMRDGLLYPTINRSQPDAECDLNLVVDQALRQRVAATLVNANWYGGASGAVVVQAPETRWPA